MQLKFNIGDSLYETYVLKFGVQGTYQRMRKVLEEMSGVDSNDRYVILAGDPRRAIEKIFGTTIDDGPKLAKLVAKLNSVEIAGASMEFTDDELARIDMQATFHGKPRQKFILEMVGEIKDRMLEQI